MVSGEGVMKSEVAKSKVIAARSWLKATPRVRLSINAGPGSPNTFPVSVSNMDRETAHQPGAAELKNVAEMPLTVLVKVVDVPGASPSKLKMAPALAAAHSSTNGQKSLADLLRFMSEIPSSTGNTTLGRKSPHRPINLFWAQQRAPRQARRVLPSPNYLDF